MDTTKLENEARLIAARFANEWGAFRRFIAAHPLTGAAITFTIGFGLGILVKAIF